METKNNSFRIKKKGKYDRVRESDIFYVMFFYSPVLAVGIVIAIASDCVMLFALVPCSCRKYLLSSYYVSWTVDRGKRGSLLTTASGLPWWSSG